ncbi:MAG: hypothetical protein IPN53_12745 [Comamonadaceae bacterium]|nr:hypothetical protein [Comamonadaceae bacterium]
MNTGIEPLLDHIDRHRRFLAEAGLLDTLRSCHHSAWVMRLLKDEFGTFGLGLVGGMAAVIERLNQHCTPQFEEYEHLRQRVLSRFQSDKQFSQLTKKEHSDEQATV